MFLDQIPRSLGDTDLIARDHLALFQWETALDAAGYFGTASAWPDIGLTTAARWLAAHWDARNESLPEPDRRYLLSRGQCHALWRSVIDASPAGGELVGSASAARWCAAARRSLLDHELEPSAQGGVAWSGDGEIFLDWCRRFEAALDAQGWIDPDCLTYRLGREAAPVGHALLLDPAPPVPAERTLERRWRGAGMRWDTVWPAGPPAAPRAVLANDPADELGLAAAWAVQVLENSPDARLAIVVPDLEYRRSEIEARLGERVGATHVWSEHGVSIKDLPPFGAALSVLELISPLGGFVQLSRWLRSPFFGAAADGDAARALELESRLRRDLRAEERFLAAYRRRGLRRELKEALPGEVAKLERALGRLPQRATPTAWAATWQACLRDLDWKGLAISAEPEVIAAWDTAIAELAALTPILGEIDFGTALCELDTIAAAQTIYRPPTTQGVHLLDRIGRVGPGYAGAWVTGFTDQAWPEGLELSPLVPWSVRVAQGMPGARPEARLAAARSELERLRSRVAVARFSCPARVLDQPQTASPEIREWLPGEDEPRLASSGGYASSRIGARALELGADPAPPLNARRVRGGARTLDLQAQCPVRAFCETRLGARPLERPAQGLSPRLRGLLVHRVLELLLEPGELGPPGKRLAASIDAAFLELPRAGSPIWNVELEVERERIGRLVERFLELESERPPFLTVDLERRVEITLAGHRLRCRIDRVDRLDFGELALIDYKTGKRPGRGWFDERLTDTQLPLYAQQAPDTTAAVVAVYLSDEKVEYRAAGIRADCVPGTQRGFGAVEWPEQIRRWRGQLSQLIEEYARGDVRLRVRGAELADGAYAPLTRLKGLLP